MPGTAARQENVPTREEIARRAYEIYVAEGRPEGRALQHWILAEASLSTERDRHQARRAGAKISAVKGRYR